MDYLKYMILCIALSMEAQTLQARVKFDDNMEAFIGTWTMQDGVGNEYEYKFQVVDGWVVLRYNFIDNFSRGTAFSASRKKNVNYTYKDGKFIYEANYPASDAYNIITLFLKEGSLIESKQHRSRGINTTYICTYEKE